MEGVFTTDFKYNNGDIIKKSEVMNITITNRDRLKSNKNKCVKKYQYKCNVCGFDCKDFFKDGIYISSYWISEYDIKDLKTCPCCLGKFVKKDINSLYKIKPECLAYIKYEDAIRVRKGNSFKIEVTCPDCGKKSMKYPNNIYNNPFSCNCCGDGKSYISKYITSILNQIQADYKTEVKYEWNKYINPLTNKLSQASIDYVLYYNNREIPLEADGGFHRGDNGMSGMTKEQAKYIDKQRDDNCLKYLGEETIRISDEGDIKDNVLNSKLNELFDLSQIDWLKCEEFALSNLVKEVCDYWNNKKELETTTGLAKIFNIHVKTIRDYLKKGAKLGWCDYNPKEEKVKSSIKNRKEIPVAMYKNENLIGIFKSASEIERISIDRFGIKLAGSNIRKVCHSERKHHGGFSFKYVDKEVFYEFGTS